MGVPGMWKNGTPGALPHLDGAPEQPAPTTGGAWTPCLEHDAGPPRGVRADLVPHGPTALHALTAPPA
jgi:hypothetical protein